MPGPAIDYISTDSGVDRWSRLLLRVRNDRHTDKLTDATENPANAAAIAGECKTIASPDINTRTPVPSTRKRPTRKSPPGSSLNANLTTNADHYPTLIN